MSSATARTADRGVVTAEDFQGPTPPDRTPIQ